MVSALGRPHLFLIFCGGGGALFFCFSVAMRLQVFSKGGSACLMPLRDLLLADSCLCFLFLCSLVVVVGTCECLGFGRFFGGPLPFYFVLLCCFVLFRFRLLMPADHRMVWALACRCMAPFLASLSLRCSVHLTARTILDDSHKC